MQHLQRSLNEIFGYRKASRTRAVKRRPRQWEVDYGDGVVGVFRTKREAQAEIDSEAAEGRTVTGPHPYY